MTLEQQLANFVTYSQQHIKGDEKGEAQIFLDRLFVAFGYPDGIKGAEATAERRIKFTLDEKSPTRFADLVIEGRVLIEMKKRGEDPGKHQLQALDYWKYLTPHPRYIILCNFDEFWVYDMERQVDYPLAKLPLINLPQSYGALLFLLPKPENPIFTKEFDLVELTKDAAKKLGEIFTLLLRPRSNGDILSAEQAQRFILQSMLALFSEDIGLLPRYTFTRIIDDCLEDSTKSYELIALLFFLMNIPGKKPTGRFYDVDYFNGGLFQQIYPVLLKPEELRLLREVANYNWAKIRPAIFGTIFESSMSATERHNAGAHFTSEIDILRVVEPVIVRPWNDRITAAKSPETLRVLHDELCRYRVFDPACGSGNFLYVAYREMKRLERQLLIKWRELTADAILLTQTVSIRQFYGFDIKPFAVELAKVTLMIAKKLVAVDELDLNENALPLDNLNDNIQVADALLTDWPDFDACIGNPPYLGWNKIKPEYGAEYVNKVRAKFSNVSGKADYCVYWFRKAHDVMKKGARCGLVGTKTISQSYSRTGSLDYIVAHEGKIFEAIALIPWSGEAGVSISIVCWSKGEPPYRPARLWINNAQDVLEVDEINTSLSPKIDVTHAKILSINISPKRLYQGITPGHEAFVITFEQGRDLIHRDLFSRKVIFPYMTGRDLTSMPAGKPSRLIIDLNDYDSLEIRQFREVYKYVETNILPVREEKAKIEQAQNERLRKDNPNASLNHHHENFLKQWWKHAWGRAELFAQLKGKTRFICCSLVTKRPIFDFVSTDIKISAKLQAFLFDDDYSYGILQSSLHWEWVLMKGTTLEVRPTYGEEVFNTFPWPQQPTPQQVRIIAQAARMLHEYRREVMRKSERLTMRDLYRSLEKPGKNPLKDLHETLDKAVMAAYGFDEQGDILAQILTLNSVVAAHIENGEPTTAPGIPTDYPDPSELVSEGCITPSELI